MCGIFGVISSTSVSFPEVKASIEALFSQSLSRGSEAAGMAVGIESRYQLTKVTQKATKFLKSEEYTAFSKKIASQPFFTLIGHARLATNGTHKNQANNQPVVSRLGHVVGVHNGIITNYESLFLELKSKKKLNQPKNDALPELDTQVLLDYFEALLIEHDFDVVAAIRILFSKIEGTANLALFLPKLNTKSPTTLLVTNHGSLHYVTSQIDDEQSAGRTYFASESIFIKKALGLESKQLKANTALIFENNSQRIIELQAAKKLRNTTSTIQLKSSSLNSIKKLKKHTIDFDRIKKIPRCSRCILPITTPFITFDAQGVCNYCHEHTPITNKGPEALEKILKKYRKKSGEPDCIVAFSGGRDSSYGLHLLAKEFGMHPIAYTYDWGMISDLGRRNQARVLGTLGVEYILKSANIGMKRNHIRQNILAWMKNPQLGMVPLFMQGDKQCEYFADQAKRNYDLPLMIYCRGNELEKEEFKTGHCGVREADPGGVIHDLAIKNKLKLLKYYGSEYLKNPSYINESFFQTAFGYFSTYWQPHDYIYLWHYLDWDEKTIEKTLTKEYNWEMSTETTTSWRIGDGTPPFYNYIYCQVQGFTENDSLRARQVREGIISRAEALDLVYSENQPQYGALAWYFDTIELDGDAVLSVVDGMRKLY